MKDFDIILGMDWLSEHHAFIDSREKKVFFEIPREELCYYQGIRSRTPKTVHTKLGYQLAEVTGEGYLVYEQDMVDEEEVTLEKLSIVNEYP